MLRLVSKRLPKKVQVVLDGLQATVDAGVDFNTRKEAAKNLWSTKGGVVGKHAFEKISKKLLEQCVFVGICNYCEHNEASDVEHIYPKSFFPEHAFRWDNYLLACKTCNSGYKLDKCYVIDNDGQIVTVQRGAEPAYKTLAFINPKEEDPTRYKYLNLKTFKFDEMTELDRISRLKYEKTIEILELNLRDTLIEARKTAYNYYYSRLRQLTEILKSETKEKLLEILSPHEDEIDHAGKSLEVLKTHFKESYRKDIVRFQHPSVWYSIKMIESKTDPKWRRLFEYLPEAANW